MSKFPRLEMMRAQRQRREAELTDPYKAELRQAAGMISSLRQRLRTIEEFLGRDIAKHVVERMAYGLRDRLMEAIYKAAAKSRKAPDKPIRLVLEPDLMRFMDPNSIEQRVLREYTSRQLPNLSLRLDRAPTEYATIVDIRVPEMGFRQMVTN